MELNICQSSEEWRSVPGYEGYLEVSSLGRVRSLDRYVPRGDTGKPVFYSGKILIFSVDKGGYPRIRASYGGVSVSLRVHRLVAIAFIENPDNKPQVNHINGVKTDNRVVNLEWSTNSENQLHAYRLDLNIRFKGKEAHRFRRGVDVYRNEEYIRTVYGNAEMLEYGLDSRAVSACLQGKRHTHKGFHLKFTRRQNEHFSFACY